MARINHLMGRAARLAKMREWWREHKRGMSCVVCGENRSPCLDYHHRDRDGKKAEVGHLVRRGYSLETIRAEIAKCTCLCANCHRLFHHHTRPETRHN